MDKITGYYKATIFEAKDNNYRINVIYEETTGDEKIVCGYFPALNREVLYEISGDYINHHKYGRQLQVKSVKQLVTKTLDGIVEYLSSSLFSGVGSKYALEVYETLGKNCLELIIENPAVLNKTKLPQKIQTVIYEGIKKNKSVEELFVKLYDIGLSNKMIMKLYEKYELKTLDVIFEDPYKLIYELEGFGFKKADELALSLGFDELCVSRIEALLMFTLFNLTENYGMTYLTEDSLINTAIKYAFSYTVDTEIFKKCLYNLKSKRKIAIDDDRVYLFSIFEAENSFSSIVKNINNQTIDKKYNKDKIFKSIEDYEESNDIRFSTDQIEAIINSLCSNISIITGGPGTGKTTIIKAIIEIYSLINGYATYDDKAYRDIILCAPTGKAAKRLREKTNFQAETIHRTLGYDINKEYTFNSSNHLPYKFIIIDEVSMIDITLAKNLFEAFKTDVKVIFVGDHNQLPSIACGDVLADLIASNIISISNLINIYRQEENSGIIKLASMVKNGAIEPYIFEDCDDLHFINSPDNLIIEYTTKLIQKAINLGYDLHEDISVLAPMYKGTNGIDSLNQAISSKFNTEYDFEINYKNKKFKQNDKVIQLSNSRELDIYNGDIGLINNKMLVNVSDKQVEKYSVVFDQRSVKLEITDFDNLNLAYATSIHKSQGSEYKIVIMPMTKSFNIMLKRKLIYTALTRAKEKLFIIGDFSALTLGVSRVEEKRQTSLIERLRNEQIKREVRTIKDPEIPFDELGERNMENITPYTFMT